jgi:hypothetical protein
VTQSGRMGCAGWDCSDPALVAKAVQAVISTFVVEFDKKSFDGYMGVKDFLEALFGCRVDLVIESAIKPRLREVIRREAMHATGL